MKRYCLIVIMITATPLAKAQEVGASDDASKPRCLLDQISFTTSFGTSSVALGDLGNANLGNITLGELNVSLKTNSHISIGVSLTGQLAIATAATMMQRAYLTALKLKKMTITTVTRLKIKTRPMIWKIVKME